VGSAAKSPADYAVKLLRPEFAREKFAITMLQRESFMSGQVSHPHLMSVLAAEVDAPPHFVVSPYLPGATIQESLAAGARFPTPHALWLVRQTAEALGALHEAGWLHCDVNPANVLVSPGGHATLIDLGLARRVPEKQLPGQEMVAGTPAYMAPELFQSPGELTAAVDIYSLGVMLYELLVGTRPYEDDDPLDLVNAHLAALPPNLRQRLPNLPSRVARLVRNMLAKDPLRRPAADELVARLTDLEIETFAERL
jgi:serine/threonine-protein kinase